MSRRKRYIENLTAQDIKKLEVGFKTGKSARFRNRCHCILLSYKRFEITQLQEIFNQSESTIYNWLNRWDNSGFEGLKTKPGQGRKPALSVDNAHHVEVVKKAVKKRAETGAKILSEIEEELEMEGELSMKILRPFLKKLISYGNASEEA